MKRVIKKLLSGVLALGLTASLLPAMSMNAQAATLSVPVGIDKSRSETNAENARTALTTGATQVQFQLVAAKNYDFPIDALEEPAPLRASNTSTGDLQGTGGNVSAAGIVTLPIQNALTAAATGDLTATIEGTMTEVYDVATPEDNRIEADNGTPSWGTASGDFDNTDDTNYSARKGTDFVLKITPDTGETLGASPSLIYYVKGRKYNAPITVGASGVGSATIPGNNITGDVSGIELTTQAITAGLEVSARVSGPKDSNVTVKGSTNLWASGAAAGKENAPQNSDYTYTITSDDEDTTVIKSITVTFGDVSSRVITETSPGLGSFTIKRDDINAAITAGDTKATIAVVTAAGVKLSVELDDPAAGMKMVTINGEKFTNFPAEKVIETGENANVVATLQDDYKLSASNISATLDPPSTATLGAVSGTTVPLTAMASAGTLTLKGWEQIAPEDLCTITFETDNATFKDADTDAVLSGTKKVPKNQNYSVKVEFPEDAEGCSVKQDGEEIGTTAQTYTIAVGDADEMTLSASSTSPSSTTSGVPALEGGDGKTDDGKTDDGKTDDGKTDDGKTDDGAVTTDFADDADIADYAKPYVKAAADAGIVKGKENNRFDPKGGATRAEFATMIQRALGLKSDKAESRFSDVKAPLNEDLINGVLACEDIDPFIVEGYPDGTFQPGKQISRAEGILMIWRAVGRPAYTGADKFTDLQSWYATAANWAADQGIALGDGQGHFNGGALLTREDLATLLGRAIEKGIIKLPTAAAADDKADDAKMDETKTDETKTEDGASDETKTDGSAAEGSSTEETKTEDTAA